MKIDGAILFGLACMIFGIGVAAAGIWLDRRLTKKPARPKVDDESTASTSISPTADQTSAKHGMDGHTTTASVSMSPEADQASSPNKWTIGVNRVKIGVRNIMQKAGLSSGAEVTLQAIKQGLVSLRLDAAVPSQVSVGEPFEVGVVVKQHDAPILVEADLPLVKSGTLQVHWPENQPFIQLKMQINAPGCLVHGEDSYRFRLYAQEDSSLFYFQLTPQQQGVISIIINVYQEENRLGSARIRTTAQEIQFGGSVQLDINSYGLIPSQPNRQSIQQLIVLHTRRLQKLKEIKAVKGINTEPHYLVEIEDIEADLEKLQLEAELSED